MRILLTAIFHLLGEASQLPNSILDSLCTNITKGLFNLHPKVKGLYFLLGQPRLEVTTRAYILPDDFLQFFNFVFGHLPGRSSRGRQLFELLGIGFVDFLPADYHLEN